MAAIVPDRQPAPVRVELDLLTSQLDPPGDPWPVSGVYNKTITITADGNWSGSVDVELSPDCVGWAVAETINSNEPFFVGEEEACYVRLVAASIINGDPTAYLTGLSYWGEV